MDDLDELARIGRLDLADPKVRAALRPPAAPRRPRKRSLGRMRAEDALLRMIGWTVGHPGRSLAVLNAEGDPLYKFTPDTGRNP